MEEWEEIGIFSDQRNSYFHDPAWRSLTRAQMEQKANEDYTALLKIDADKFQVGVLYKVIGAVAAEYHWRIQ